MLLLISPSTIAEARECVLGGADIVDVKNPSEGSLGANFPWLIREIRDRIVPRGTPVSATIGDAPFKPGTMSLAARGLAYCDVQFIKVGVFGPKNVDEGLELLLAVTKAVKEVDSDIKVVAACYADWERANTLPPHVLPSIAPRAGCDVCMIDTAIKDGKSLLAFQTVGELQSFVDAGHKHGMEVALAGGLRKEDLITLQELGADIAGVRSAACSNGNRVTGNIDAARVRELKCLISQ